MITHQIPHVASGLFAVLAVGAKYSKGSEEEQQKIVSQISDLDKQLAESFVKSDEKEDFECELTEITKEETMTKLAELFE